MKSGKEMVDPSKYQVFVCACRASIPVQFASHPWFVCNDRGDISRWEVLLTANKEGGHLHRNLFKPFEGVDVFLFRTPWRWSNVNVLGVVEGVVAQEMIAFIKESANHYPYKEYSLTGPNSNTYVQWILDAFPEANMALPKNSFGKNYHIKHAKN